MSDVFKLQYNGMTLAYPGWNGFVTYEVSSGDESIWDGTYDYSWYDTVSDEFHLTSCAQFMAFANLCNGSAGGFAQDHFNGKTVYLDVSMIINENYDEYETWGTTPPTYSMPNNGIAFNGTLDGQFHRISGAYKINTANWGSACLFSVGGTAKLKDLIIENYYFASDYGRLIHTSASLFTLEGVIFKNGIVRLLNLKASEPSGPCIVIWEGNGSTVYEVDMSNCGAYNIVFDGTYHNAGTQRENWGTLISNNRFGSNFDAINGIATLNNCFVCSCNMIPLSASTARVRYYKIAGTKTNTFTSCFEYDIKARYSSNTPSTTIPTAQGTAASSVADLIEKYNNANTIPKYTLNSDFTFRGT